MSGPTNAVFGDIDNPTSVPVTTIPDEVMVEERKLAKYSRTEEFKRLKEFMEARITFYQSYLPDGRSLREVDDVSELGQKWLAANLVIQEFQGILDSYENARQNAK